MAFVNIENSPISVQLNNESITVPQGETWKVSISVSFSGSFDGANFTINNVKILDSLHHEVGFIHTFNTFLTSGDVISANNNRTTAHIAGFVVQGGV